MGRERATSCFEIRGCVSTRAWSGVLRLAFPEDPYERNARGREDPSVEGQFNAADRRVSWRLRQPRSVRTTHEVNGIDVADSTVVVAQSDLEAFRRLCDI